MRTDGLGTGGHLRNFSIPAFETYFLRSLWLGNLDPRTDWISCAHFSCTSGFKVIKRMAQVNVVLVVSAPARKKSSQMLTSWSTQKDDAMLLEFCLKNESNN